MIFYLIFISYQFSFYSNFHFISIFFYFNFHFHFHFHFNFYFSTSLSTHQIFGDNWLYFCNEFNIRRLHNYSICLCVARYFFLWYFCFLPFFFLSIVLSFLICLPKSVCSYRLIFLNLPIDMSLSLSLSHISHNLPVSRILSGKESLRRGLHLTPWETRWALEEYHNSHPYLFFFFSFNIW